MLRLLVAKTNQFLLKSLICLLRGYQYLISPMLGNRCRFYPSCSNYAIEAMEKYHLMKACYLVLRRILRCHPFHPGGHDPVVTAVKTSSPKVKKNVR